MLVSALDGRGIDVRRRWLPWRVRKRNVTEQALSSLDVLDGLEGLVISIIFAILVFLFGSIILFGFEIVLVAVLLVPLLALMRFFWVLPWVVEARNGDTLLGVERIRGWRDSSARIHEIATAYQQGRDPFAQGSSGGLDFTGTR